MPALLWIMIWFALMPPDALGHEIAHRVERAEAVILTLSFADQTPLAFAYYEVRGQGDDALLQLGQTDAGGRLSFVPHADGEYRVRVFSDDGHGLDIVVPIDAAGLPTQSGSPIVERYARPVLGVGVLLGVFGVVALLRCGRRSPNPD
jgi:nickel transport protein